MTTNEQIAYALLEYASILREEILDESIHGKTKADYAKRAFKEKYNYDPKDKTITVDGKKHRIIIEGEHEDANKPRGLNNTKPLATETGAYTANKHGGIYLDKNFWKLKNGQRREAALQHEIGHLKLHGINSKSKHLDRELVNDNNIKRTSYFGNTADIANIDRMNKLVDKNKDNQRNKDRRDNIDKYKKYEVPKTHANTNEFEADRYAANKCGTKNAKKCVSEYYKKIDKKIDREIPKEYKKYFNIRAQIDMKQRSKALKDKSIKGSVYTDKKPKNETVELLRNRLALCENIEEMNIINDAISRLED